MAKDRANDPNRVYQNPISHVNPVSTSKAPKLEDHKWTVDHAEADTGTKYVANRKDSRGKTRKGVSDYYNKDNARIHENAVNTFNERKRAEGKTKVIKIDSGK